MSNDPNSTGVCIKRSHRIRIAELAPQVQASTKLSIDYINAAFYGYNNEPTDYKKKSLDRLGVNHGNDSLTPDEKKAGFNPKTSISREEVYRYIDRVRHFLPSKNRITVFTNHSKDKIAAALYKIYFGDDTLYEADRGTPNGTSPHENRPLKFYQKHSYMNSDEYCEVFSLNGCYCHDADTCNVIEFDSDECFKEGFYSYLGTYREANGDAPERGEIPYYPNNPSDPKNAEKQAFNKKLIEWVYLKVNRPDFNQPAPAFTNAKLIDNGIKILNEIVKNSSVLSKEELFHVLRLVTTWIDYDGTLAMIVANDFTDFIEQQTGLIATEENINQVAQKLPQSFAAFFSRGTTIRFSSDDTPPWVCTFKQQVDRYLREIVMPMVTAQDMIGRYLDERYKTSFLAICEGTQIYPKYQGKLTEITAILKNSRNPQVLNIIEAFDKNKLHQPSTLLPDVQRFKSLVAGFFLKHPQYANDYSASVSLLKILLGITYPYQKYRSQDYKLFHDAGVFARTNSFAFWQKGNPTFTTLWEINQKIPRYIIKDCLTGED